MKDSKKHSAPDASGECMMESGTAELVNRAKSGNDDAFEELVVKYRRMVYGTALRELNNPADAEDAAQEAFVKAWKSLGSCADGEKFAPWLYVIVKNTCTDFLRAKIRRPSAQSIYADNEEDAPAHDIADISSDTPEQAVLRKETVQTVRDAVKSLPPDQRTAVELRDMHGFSYSQIAQATGEAEGTVKSRIFRGREAVKKFLEKRNIYLP